MTNKEQLAEMVKDYAMTLESVVRGDFYNSPDIIEDHGSELAAYLEDVLDVEFTCDINRQFIGVKITLACGGPTVTFDTRESAVIGYWWSDRAEWHVKSFANDAIEDYFAELWVSTR